MNRRDFLRRTSLALPALLVGDEALAAFERMAHRKVFALGGLSEMTPQKWGGMGHYLDVVGSTSVHRLSTSTYPEWAAYGDAAVPMEAAYVRRLRDHLYRRATDA